MLLNGKLKRFEVHIDADVKNAAPKNQMAASSTRWRHGRARPGHPRLENAKPPETGVYSFLHLDTGAAERQSHGLTILTTGGQFQPANENDYIAGG